MKKDEDFYSIENIRRMKANNQTTRRGDRKFCKNGHPYDKENTGFWPNGEVYCKTCHAALRARQRARFRRGEPGIKSGEWTKGKKD